MRRGSDSPSLARLRVDPDDSLVRSSNIGRVDRQIRHVPHELLSLLQALLLLVRDLNPLFDRVLMAARKGGENELARVGVSRVAGEGDAFGDGIGDGLEVGEIDVGGDALGVEVEGEGDKVDVAGSLAVSEEAALDSVSSSEETELGGGDSGSYVRGKRGEEEVDVSQAKRKNTSWELTSVVVRMQRDDDLLSFGDVRRKVLDLRKI
jgi:hypothetical protein